MEIVDDDPLWSGFSIGPDTARCLSARLEVLRPKKILDCGSGASTVVFAAYASRHPMVQVTSLEHEPRYAAATKQELKGRGLSAQVKLVTCGLTPLNWYDWTPKDDVLFDFVLVDGPPGSLDGRRGALPRLWTWLADDFELWLDDAQRPNEARALAQWEANFPVVTSPLNDRVTVVHRRSL